MICLEQDADKDLFVFSSNRNNTALTHTLISYDVYIYQFTFNVQLNSGSSSKLFYFQHKKQSKSTCEYVWRKLFESIRSIRVFYPLAIPIKFSRSHTVSLNLLITSAPFFSPASSRFWYTFEKIHEMWIDVCVCVSVFFGNHIVEILRVKTVKICHKRKTFRLFLGARLKCISKSNWVACRWKEIPFHSSR